MYRLEVLFDWWEETRDRLADVIGWAPDLQYGCGLSWAFATLEGAQLAQIRLRQRISHAPEWRGLPQMFLGLYDATSGKQLRLDDVPAAPACERNFELEHQVKQWAGAFEPFVPSAQGRILMQLREQELATKGTLPEASPCDSDPKWAEMSRIDDLFDAGAEYDALRRQHEAPRAAATRTRKTRGAPARSTRRSKRRARAEVRA